uniref:Uncharacterized protein n=1 Tax=candidate division WWE3 bacterium TaxID=2053526 RepID=A0A7C4TQT0_UNCKA
MSVLGSRLSAEDLPRIRNGDRLILSYGAGHGRVLATVSACCSPRIQAGDKLLMVTILEIDPRTGSAAPTEVVVGANLAVPIENLYLLPHP